MGPNDSPTRALRVDAERNRGRIVEAASSAFAVHGLDASLDGVAERAGVGIATLYRRFPTRDDLIAACFERRIAEYARAAEEALEAPDGWTGLCDYVERVCAMQAADRGLTDGPSPTPSDSRRIGPAATSSSSGSSSAPNARDRFDRMSCPRISCCS